MGREAEGEEVARVGEADVGDLAVVDDEHGREPGGDDHRHRDKREQLSVARAQLPLPPPP